jgi:hypothetical protein
MRNLICLAFFLSILATLFQPAFASDISILASPPGLGTSLVTPEEIQSNSYLLFSGEIQKGDAEKLAKVLMQAHPFGTMLVLDSPGGDVEEALRIALLAKTLHLDTVVESGGTCASACFFIWLAGNNRIADGTIDGRMPKRVAGYLGLHRPYLKSDPAKKSSSTDAITRQHNVMQKTSTYLRNEDVPQRLIDLMMSRPSNDIYWMTQDDRDQLGAFSPGHEELLISRCGYSRNMFDGHDIAIGLARQRGDRAAEVRENERWNTLVRAFGECQATAFPDLVEESFKNTERLRKGWRPWLKSKVAGKRQ